MMDMRDFYPDDRQEPPRIPQPIQTEWTEDLVLIRKQGNQLGLDAQIEILKVVVEVLKYAKIVQLEDAEADQIIDDVNRIILSMDGR